VGLVGPGRTRSQGVSGERNGLGHGLTSRSSLTGREQTENTRKRTEDERETSAAKGTPWPSAAAKLSADESADSHAPGEADPHASANRPPPPSRLFGYKRNKLTLEQEWAVIRKEYAAPPGAKMFVLDGSFPGVRDALRDRGWAEHNELDSMCFDFKWTIKTTGIDFSRLQPTQIVNHFKKNRAVTTKVGLSRSLRALKWFEEVDSDSFFPRSYDLDDLEEVHTFVEDFMLVTAQNAVVSFLSSSSSSSTPASPCIHRANLGLLACEDFVRHWEADVDLDEADDKTDARCEQHAETTLRGAPSRLCAEEWSTVLGEVCPIAAVRFVVGGDIAETCCQAVTNKSACLSSFLKGLRSCGVISAGGGSARGKAGKSGGGE